MSRSLLLYNLLLIVEIYVSLIHFRDESPLDTHDTHINLLITFTSKRYDMSIRNSIDFNTPSCHFSRPFWFQCGVRSSFVLSPLDRKSVV